MVLKSKKLLLTTNNAKSHEYILVNYLCKKISLSTRNYQQYFTLNLINLCNFDFIVNTLSQILHKDFLIYLIISAQLNKTINKIKLNLLAKNIHFRNCTNKTVLFNSL